MFTSSSLSSQGQDIDAVFLETEACFPRVLESQPDFTAKLCCLRYPCSTVQCKGAQFGFPVLENRSRTDSSLSGDQFCRSESIPRVSPGGHLALPLTA